MKKGITAETPFTLFVKKELSHIDLVCTSPALLFYKPAKPCGARVLPGTFAGTLPGTCSTCPEHWNI